MLDESKYFLVKKKAVPEVLLKVVEAKKLLESNKNLTIQEVAEKVGISRSSYYRYSVVCGIAAVYKSGGKKLYDGSDG